MVTYTLRQTARRCRSGRRTAARLVLRAGGKLKRIDVAEGPPQTLWEVSRFSVRRRAGDVSRPGDGRSEAACGAILAVMVQAGGDSLRAGVPQQLFTLPGVRYLAGSPDGRRFLAEARREPHQSHINIVVNWAEDLRP